MVVTRYKFLILSTICLVGIHYFLNSVKPHSLKPMKPDLIIYSYSSFTAKWGPGPLIKKKFEDRCHCKIELREIDDARMLVQRLALEKERAVADIVLGINQWDLVDAQEKLEFSREHWPSEMNLKDPQWRSELGNPGELVAFDWGILTFNTKKDLKIAKAKNLKEFLNLLPEKSLVLQDPRTSAPGQSFLNWLVQVLGEEAAFDYLEKLNKKVYAITSGWSSSYGLFQKGHVQSVFSYVTSPLYHVVEENDKNYVALNFQEGLPLHMEFAGVMKSSRNAAMAKEFIQFLLSSEIQALLMKKNYMFPIDKKVAENTLWDIESKFKVLPVSKISKEDQDRILERWTQWSRKR